jgi:hypothetical protein
MAIPKKIKKTLPLKDKKYFLDRRQELLGEINQDGTYLPKSILHADLDRGMLDFVKEDLEVIVSGNKIPTVDIIVTTQNWSQFTQTWDFQNLDKNISVPFITTVRQPEVKYGSNPSLQYTIPNRRQFYYVKVPTWDGMRKGMDIYKIPQPTPVDITYNVKIFCNRMRELNEFNKLVLQTFSSRQAYRQIKGHYIPIILDNVSDESVIDLEKRKYFIQNYTFTMLGFLMDEEEFEVSPAISRSLILSEFDLSNKKKKIKKYPENPEEFNITFNFENGVSEMNMTFDYGTDLTISNTVNVEEQEFYLNDIFIGGSNVTSVPISLNDNLKVIIIKTDNSESSQIVFESRLINSSVNNDVLQSLTTQSLNSSISTTENLTARENELFYSDGTPYPAGAKYHIHPEKGPMEGAYHTSEPHRYLSFGTQGSSSRTTNNTSQSSSSNVSRTNSGGSGYY